MSDFQGFGSKLLQVQRVQSLTLPTRTLSFPTSQVTASLLNKIMRMALPPEHQLLVYPSLILRLAELQVTLLPAQRMCTFFAAREAALPGPGPVLTSQVERRVPSARISPVALCAE